MKEVDDLLKKVAEFKSKVTEFKYSEDQERDEQGRFSGGGGSSGGSSPQSQAAWKATEATNGIGIRSKADREKHAAAKEAHSKAAQEARDLAKNTSDPVQKENLKQQAQEHFQQTLIHLNASLGKRYQTGYRAQGIPGIH